MPDYLWRDPKARKQSCLTLFILFIHMNLRNLLVLFFALSGAVAAAPGTSLQSTTVEVGGKLLIIPIPAGFADSASNESLSLIGETLTPRARRMVAFFVTQNDLAAASSNNEPDFDQSLSVQTGRADEHKTLTVDSFKIVRQKIRSDYQALLSRAAEGRPENLDAYFKELSKKTGEPLSVKINDVIPLGIIEESDQSITYAVLSTAQLRSGDQVTNVPSMSALTIAIVRGKPIWLKTNVTIRKPEDIDQTLELAKRWATEVLRVNGT